jgi:protein-L-isoaspartate(D-aspartate) O-methyltransferase
VKISFPHNRPRATSPRAIIRAHAARSITRRALVGSSSLSSLRMAWRSHGVDNDSLVRALEKNAIIKSPRVANAMRAVDRGNYARHKEKEEAYYDHPLPIGYHATISAPHMHAACLELFEQADATRRGAKVLDVGSGSGYLAACFAELVTSEAFRNGEKDETGEGIVVGIEHIEELVVDSLKNVERDGKGRLLETKRLMLFAGDGRNGYKPEAPYDAIHVGASTPSVPDALLEQLAVGGRLVIPVGDSSGQALKVIDRLEDGTFKRRTEMGVIYVPLTDRASQLSLF